MHNMKIIFRYFTSILAFLPTLLITSSGICQNPRENDNLNSFADKAFSDSIAIQFGDLLPETPPEYLYSLFNRFCLTHFGAGADPVVYNTFGDVLKETVDSEWSYISERSAVMAWSTNLPAKGYVEYGQSASYGNKSELPERFFYTHIHYLKHLKENTSYHYRLVSIDEKGRRLMSEDRVFQTKNIPGAIHIPEDMGNPPYNLDRNNAVYVVTEDIVADRNAFNISANGITLDLGGHTVIHANSLINDLDYEDAEKSGTGIRMYTGKEQSGLRILNGFIKQGKADNNSEYTPAKRMVHPSEERKKLLGHNMSKGLNSIELTNCSDVEIAGITAEYRLSQTWGMQFTGSGGTFNIHHNICLDKGTLMFSRHGDGGSRSIGFRGADGKDIAHIHNDFTLHHNLIKRTRQNGINIAQKIVENEIYVDSWVCELFCYLSPPGGSAGCTTIKFSSPVIMAAVFYGQPETLMCGITSSTWKVLLPWWKNRIRAAV